jgi:DNA mismatch endonuclease (patch repair protein)
VDFLSPTVRSAVMRRIRSANTGPEVAVRRALRTMSIGYRLHVAGLPGTPDIVVPGRRQVLLVHGCFWHQHPRCRGGRMPQSRHEYWRAKFLQVRNRDQRTRDALTRLGWRVDVIWECETEDTDILLLRLCEVLRGD